LAIDARMINHSGIGTYIKNMIPNLVENYNLTLLGNVKMLSSFPWSKEIKIIGAKSSIYSISEQMELPNKIPNCHLFISPHYNIPLRKIKASKRVVIIHDVNHLVFANLLSIPKKIYARYMINSAIRKSDKIITISSFSKKEIVKYADTKGKEIKIIFCGLDKGKLKSNLNEQSMQSVKSIYNLPEDYFLYVGSIKPHKNLKAVIKAFNILSKEFPAKKLVVAGVRFEQLNEDKEILNLYDEKNMIVTGFIKDSDLFPIYNMAECLIFPSLYEGFGLPPLEAMICGCPVIASNSSSIPEACGNAALYFDPFKVDELVEKMKLIINDKNLRSELINNGFTNVERFSWKRFAENLKIEFDDTILN
jgi:glycosyltransferase involved in cell wall biosynthesis